MTEIVSLLKKGDAVAFCGAGFSCESGVPTFRGRGGLWERYDPALYASQEGLAVLFAHQPQKISNFIIDFYSLLLRSEPNFAHYCLAGLEKKGLLIGTITQNIDDFQRQAGAVNIAEIHGNAYLFRCPQCSDSIKKSKEEVKDFIAHLKTKINRQGILRAILKFAGRCPRCRQRLMSGVVLFGQQLPQKEMDKSYAYINKAKSVLCIGTSGIVYPAATIPYLAKEKGAKIIMVNPQATSLDAIVDYVVPDTAVNFFTRVMSLL